MDSFIEKTGVRATMPLSRKCLVTLLERHAVPPNAIELLNSKHGFHDVLILHEPPEETVLGRSTFYLDLELR